MLVTERSNTVIPHLFFNFHGLECEYFSPVALGQPCWCLLRDLPSVCISSRSHNVHVAVAHAGLAHLEQLHLPSSWVPCRQMYKTMLSLLVYNYSAAPLLVFSTNLLAATVIIVYSLLCGAMPAVLKPFTPTYWIPNIHVSLLSEFLQYNLIGQWLMNCNNIFTVTTSWIHSEQSAFCTAVDIWTSYFSYTLPSAFSKGEIGLAA